MFENIFAVVEEKKKAAQPLLSESRILVLRKTRRTQICIDAVWLRQVIHQNAVLSQVQNRRAPWILKAGAVEKVVIFINLWENPSPECSC